MKHIAATTNAIALVDPRRPELLHVEPRSDLVRAEKVVVAPLLDADELAAALSVSRFTVYRLASREMIPVVRIGRRVRFALAEVVAALRADARPPTETAPPTAAVAPRRAPAIRPAPAPAAPHREPPIDEAERIRAVVAATSRLGERR